MSEYYVDTDRTFGPSTSIVPFVHFTNEFNKLYKIIEEGFIPNYCVETLSNNEREIKAAFPMISLSNLTIEEAKYDLGSYGTFGIALNKSFVEKHKFNPVLYLDRYSDITKYIINSFDVIRDEYWEGRLESNLFNELSKSKSVLFSKNLLTQFAYSKNYDADLIRKGCLIHKNYTFGLEREWRIVHKDESLKYFLINSDIDNKENFNEKLREIRYTIEKEDIVEILVETDYQVNGIKKLLSKKYNFNNMKITINNRRHIDDE